MKACLPQLYRSLYFVFLILGPCAGQLGCFLHHSAHANRVKNAQRYPGAGIGNEKRQRKWYRRMVLNLTPDNRCPSQLPSETASNNTCKKKTRIIKLPGAGPKSQKNKYSEATEIGKPYNYTSVLKSCYNSSVLLFSSAFPVSNPGAGYLFAQS